MPTHAAESVLRLLELYEIANDTFESEVAALDWLADGKSLGLWVPSYVEPAEHNLLINPAHPEFAGIKLVIERNPFVFDPRLQRPRIGSPVAYAQGAIN
jgi:RES domain-containing protein